MRGMSIIEVLIGVIILALILIPAMSVISHGTQTVSATREHLEAVYMAQRVIEIGRTFDFQHLAKAQHTAAAEQKLTFEYDAGFDDNTDPLDRVKQKEQINGVIYEIKDFKIEQLSDRNTTTNKVPMMVYSFAIEYLSRDKKPHRLDASSAIVRKE